MNKNSLLKKVGIGALTTAIVASQFVSTIPYNVLADQVQTNQTNVPSVTSTIDKSTTTSAKTKPVVGATVGDSGDIQLDTSLNDLSAWGAIVNTYSTNKFVFVETDYYDNPPGSEDEYTIDGAAPGQGHYVALASILRGTEYGTMVGVKANDYPTAGTQGLGQVFNTVPGRTYSFTYTALATTRSPSRNGVIAFSNYTGGLLQNLEHSNPLAKSYIPEMHYWGDTYTDTVTFTATGNQTYLQILMSPSGGELYFPKLGTIENVTKDTTPPEITASDKTLTVGDSFDPKADVTANDDTDGDITSKIEVTSNNVDTSKAGTYNVTYSVTDAAGNNTTKTITITVNDAPDTTKPEITASDKTLTVGDSFDPKADVTASDDKDGDITSKIQVTSNNVDTSKAGTYNVTYSVTDAAGNTATKTITVTVNDAPDTTKPEITASDKTLTVGDSFDPKAGVTATDNKDGDITSKIQVTSNNVDTSKAGTYNVTYSVTDAAGNTATKTITVTVNDAPDTTKPEITASDKTLTVGDSFDPKAGVTANDNKDGDITSKIQVTSNNVDTSKAGTYNVTYSVTDAAGNTATKTITVTVNDAPDTTKPEITASDKTLAVGDSFDPKAGVTATDNKDGDITSKLVVTSNNVDTSKAGTYNVTYSVTDAAGNTATKTITVTVKLSVALSIDPVKSTDLKVVLHGNPGSLARLFNDDNGTAIGNRFRFGADGTYTMSLPLALPSGTHLRVWYTYNQKVIAKTIVIDATKPVITASDKTLTVGDSFDPKASITANDDLDGDITSKIQVTSNNVDTSKAGTYNVTYSVTDAAGNTATKTITVTVNDAPDTTKPEITASNKTLKVGDSFDPKAGVTATDNKDGDITSKIQVTSNNVDTSKAGTYNVTYSVTDAAGNTATKTITVTVISTTQGTITANTFTIGKDGYVTGSYTGDVKKLSLLVNGKKLGTINATGTPYKYYAGKNITSINDSVTVVAYDANGKELDRANVPLKKEAATTGTITANTFTIGKDGYVTGSYTGDVKKLSLLVNGKKLGTINATGTPYKYYAGKNITSTNDSVTVVAYDANGKELDRANVPLKKEAATTGTITANTFTIGQDSYVKGNLTGDVAKVKMLVNGKSYVTISASGTSYQYYASGKILSAKDAVTMIAYDTNGKELDRANVPVKEAMTTGTITANTFTIGKDGYVKGNVTGDVSRVKMIINGVSYPVIGVTGSNYQYYANGKILSNNDAVTMVAYDNKGKELARTNVSVVKENVPTTGTITANKFTIGKDGYITGNLTGDVAKIKMVVDGKSSTLVAAKEGAYKYYAGGKIASVNDAVTMIAYDAKGNELDRANVPLAENSVPVGTVTAEAYTIGSGYIHGTYTGDASRIGVLVNGKEISRINATTSPYQYYVGSQVTSTNDDVYVVIYDNKGREMDRVKVPVQAKVNPTAGTITANPFSIGKDSYVKGSFTGDVARIAMLVNGTEYSRIPANGGEYQYYASGKILSASDNVTMVAYDAKGKELDRAVVSVTAPQGTIAVDAYQVGGSDAYIHGTATGDVKKVQLIVNGAEQGVAFVQADGTFKYYAKAVTSPSDQAVIVALDERGRELDRKTVTLTNATGTVKADTFTVGGSDRYIHGTATGAVTKVGIEVNGVVGTSQAFVQADGTYKYFAGSQIGSSSDVVYVIGYDGKSKEIARTPLSLQSN